MFSFTNSLPLQCPGFRWSPDVARALEECPIAFEIVLWTGHRAGFGRGTPRLWILVMNRSGMRALQTLDEMRICEAYMQSDIDIQGSIMDFVELRQLLTDAHPLHSLWRRLAPHVLGRVAIDRQAIAHHYEHDSEFYLTFLDATRCYSHAVFAWDHESLEVAQRRKLEYAVTACGLKPGARVLDVGGGWGAFAEHAGRSGIEVTALTISQRSEVFLNGLFQRQALPGRVVNADFMEYDSKDPFDAIVVLGVMEHLPDYRGVLRQFNKLLKPEGRVYIDASASTQVYGKPTFISRYVFPGDHTFFCLHSFLRALAHSSMEVMAIINDRHNYYLTCQRWAENLDRKRDEIVSHWGEALYRRFRLYLWGSVAAFLHGGVSAYRVVLQKTEDRLHSTNL